MIIKNHTSEVPMATTIARIEDKLAAAGATGITKMYGPDKRVISLVFGFEVGHGREFRFKVPANVRTCYEAMLKDYRLRTSKPAKEHLAERNE